MRSKRPNIGARSSRAKWIPLWNARQYVRWSALLYPCNAKKNLFYLELAGRVAAMEDLALHTFMIGLHPRLSQIVRCRNPETLNTAVAFAVAEEKILLSLNRKIPSTNNGRPDNLRNANDLVCRYCKNVGHSIENCRKRQYNNSRNNASSSQNNRYNNQPHIPLSASPRRVFVTDQVNESGEDVPDHNLNE
ncbi:hypothetical protein ACJJTC_005791 [Scirpophaga incertulas]